MFVKLYKTSLVVDPKYDGIHSNLVALYTGKSVNTNALVCISDCASSIAIPINQRARSSNGLKNF